MPESYLTERIKLAARRRHEGVEITWGKDTFSIGAGPLEMWVSSHKKPGSEVEQIARDGCILVSLALQHGATIEEINEALNRTPQNEPATIIGAAVQAVIDNNLDIIPRNITIARPVGEERKLKFETRSEIRERPPVVAAPTESSPEITARAEA